MQSQQTTISSVENNRAITIALEILKECRESFIERIASKNSPEHYSLRRAITKYRNSNSMTNNYMAYLRGIYSLQHFEIMEHKNINDRMKQIVSQKLAHLLLKINIPISCEYAEQLSKQNKDIFNKFASFDYDIKLKSEIIEYELEKMKMEYENKRDEYLRKKNQ